MLDYGGQLIILNSGHEVSMQSLKKQDIEQLYGAEYSFYSNELLDTVEQYNEFYYVTALVYDYRDRGSLGHLRYLAKLARCYSVMLVIINHDSGAIIEKKPIIVYSIGSSYEQLITGYEHHIYFYCNQPLLNLGSRIEHEGSSYIVNQKNIQWGKSFFNAAVGGSRG